MDATDDQIEAARTKVRNMLHAADHGNHLGEVAVMRMAASEELQDALKAILDGLIASREDIGVDDWIEVAASAISKAEGSTLMERRV